MDNQSHRSNFKYFILYSDHHMSFVFKAYFLSPFFFLFFLSYNSQGKSILILAVVGGAVGVAAAVGLALKYMSLRSTPAAPRVLSP
jgi:predicted NodU family carbamoyl transferase